MLLLFRCALVLSLAGCATGRRSIVENADWDGRVGSYTYDEAVAELGKPDVVVESNEGTTAEWILKRSPNISFGFGVGSGSYGRHSGVGMGVGSSVSPPPHGEYLRLIFGTNSTLTQWNKIRY